jgi:hypothetical protein
MLLFLINAYLNKIILLDQLATLTEAQQSAPLSMAIVYPWLYKARSI